MQQLSNGLEVYVPAGHVHLGFSPSSPEPMVTLPISTGLAFNSELSRAIWSGLCEVAERDALMLAWWNRRSLPKIELTNTRLPELLAERLARLHCVGLAAHLFDMTTDFRVPSVLCLVTSDSYPFVVAGTACHADPVLACAKAIDEGASARFVTNGTAWSRDIPSFTDFSWVSHLEDHIMLYASWEGSPAFDFLLHSGSPALSFDKFVRTDWWPTPSSQPTLESLAGKLDELDLTVLWRDVTAPEALGLGHVVKVVVPQMVPLSQSHNARWLATARLLRAARLVDAHASDFNPYPHPFA